MAFKKLKSCTTSVILKKSYANCRVRTPSGQHGHPHDRYYNLLSAYIYVFFSINKNHLQ